MSKVTWVWFCNTTQLPPFSHPVKVFKTNISCDLSHVFSSSWHQLHVFASSSLWFTVLFASVVNGQSNLTLVFSLWHSSESSSPYGHVFMRNVKGTLTYFSEPLLRKIHCHVIASFLLIWELIHGLELFLHPSPKIWRVFQSIAFLPNGGSLKIVRYFTLIRKLTEMVFLFLRL